MHIELLNLAIFLPLIGAVCVVLYPWLVRKPGHEAIERIALAFSTLSLLASGYLWYAYAAVQKVGDQPALLSVSRDWIRDFNIRYSIGVDGFSMPMIFLTALLSTVCIYFSFGRVVHRVREYYFFMLLLEVFLLGVFAAQDLFLFYVLFDASLIPMYFLIALWGGERRAHAALRFLIYTLAGSAALLIGILWVYFRSAGLGAAPTFDMGELPGLLRHNVPLDAQIILFALFGIAFAVKIPLFPFHTWLPDAYVEAPAAATAMLAGAMGKMGVYGFLRLAVPFFPEGAHWWAIPLAVIGVISAVYGALVALAQWDLKRLVAYSSVSHMGFVALALAAVSRSAGSSASIAGMPVGSVAVSAVLFEMFAHGLITGGLFLLIGMLGPSPDQRNLHSLTGVMRRAPTFIFLFAIFMFATMGMPGMMGFWGELYVLLGSFPLFPLATALVAIAIVVTAGFFVWALQRMAYGQASASAEKLNDLTSRDLLTVLPLLFLIFLFGIGPGWYLGSLTPTIRWLVEHLAMR